MTSSKNSLIVQGLTKIYGNETKALNGINLSINNGMYGLLGPNGAGKSSLMRTIATLQNSTSGAIFFNGVNIHDDPKYLRRNLGYLPQEFGVYPGVSAEKLLEYIAILKGLLDKKERNYQVKNLLQETNLYEYRKKSVSNFSGGMKQRFGIAQALLGNPRIIIVDEPTSGLDPEEKMRFLNILVKIGKSVIVILSTHIVEDILDLCDDMSIMIRGQIIRSGRPDKLIEELKGRVWSAVLSDQDYSEIPTNCQVLSEKTTSKGRQVLILSSSSPGKSFIQVEPDLENFYFATINHYNLH